MSPPCPRPLRRAALLLIVAAVLPTSSGCVLWAFHERNKALDRQKKQQAAADSAHEQCKATMAREVAVPPGPPEVAIEGDWQCLFSAPDGGALSEWLTFVTDGRKVAVTGRDNYGNNIVADGQTGARIVTFRHSEEALVRVSIDRTGRLLDGQVMYWVPPMQVCHATKYRCRRRD